MLEREPSHTAMSVAACRAAHQILEGGRIFSDPYAVPILGQDPETLKRDAAASPSRQWVRLFVVARSNFAEAKLKTGVETRSITQLVILGAGLDTFGYRNPFGNRLRVFEVDHPATQAWKRRRLKTAGIPVPASLSFTPVDFERDSLLESLTSVGFDPRQRTFFTWLGVIPYLTEDAIRGTFTLMASLPSGAEVVFDYSDPPDLLPPELKAKRLQIAARAASVGEPMISNFEPETMHTLLDQCGFTVEEDMGPRAFAAHYGAGGETVSDHGSHFLFARSKVAPR